MEIHGGKKDSQSRSYPYFYIHPQNGVSVYAVRTCITVLILSFRPDLTDNVCISIHTKYKAKKTLTCTVDIF